MRVKDTFDKLFKIVLRKKHLPEIERTFFDLCKRDIRSIAMDTRPKYRRILITPVTGISQNYRIREGLIAKALQLRGCDVKFLLCDGTIPICNDRSVAFDNPSICDNCIQEKNNTWPKTGFEIFEWKDLISDKEVSEIKQEVETLNINQILNYEIDGYDYGKLVWSGFLRYHLAGDIKPFLNEKYLHQFRQFLETSLIVRKSMQNLMNIWRPDKVLTSHGYYPVWGSIFYTCRSLGIDVDTFDEGEIKGAIRLLHNKPGSPINFDEEWELWKDPPLNSQQKKKLREYFYHKDYDPQGYIRYHSKGDSQQTDMLMNQIESTRREKTICIYTNVMWDAITSGMNRIYPSMMDWIYDTLAFLMDKQNLQVIIRIHPGEIRKPERAVQRVADFVEEHFGRLPDHFMLIDAHDKFLTSRLYSLNALHLVYYTTVGLELALRGELVVASGNTSYSKKGFTLDPESTSEYKSLIQLYLNNELFYKPNVEIAERFAFFYYFQKCIPFDLIDTEVWTHVSIKIKSIAEMLPSRNKYLDIICEGICNGGDFVIKK